MLNKVTAIAPANIAFIKYWGRRDHKLFIPNNDSISMTMSGCLTKTTVQLRNDLIRDSVEVKFFGKRYKNLNRRTTKEMNLFDQIDRIRKLAGVKEKIKIRSENNFPSDAGIAASASSFSALTAALLVAFGMREKFEDKKELSKQIRLSGSSSAVRSAMGGFVELKAGKRHEDTYCRQIADENHWNLADIVAVVDPEKKPVSSSAGHVFAGTSPYYKTRLREMKERIKGVRKAILAKDLQKLGQLIEQDSTSMHLIMMTSNPPIYYWGPGSIRIMKDLIKWREEEGLQAYFTLDAGPNVHVICEKKDAKKVQMRLRRNKFVKWTIYNGPCAAVRLSEDHLF